MGDDPDGTLQCVCKCGDSFSLKGNLKRHLSRNVATCLPRFDTEDLSRYGLSVESIMSIPPRSTGTVATRTTPPPCPPRPPPANVPPSAPSPTTTPAFKRPRTSSSTDYDNHDDFGGFTSDGDDLWGSEGSAGEGGLPSPSSGSGGGKGVTNSAKPPDKPVLLYDVMRSKRVDELLMCFDQEPPYKPVQVSRA